MRNLQVPICTGGLETTVGGYTIAFIPASSHPLINNQFCYQVTPPINPPFNLSHFVLGFDLTFCAPDFVQLLKEMEEDMPGSVIEACTTVPLDTSVTCELVNPDPTTGVIGFKFDNISTAAEISTTFCVKFNDSIPLSLGCGVIGVKVGNDGLVSTETIPVPGCPHQK